ncbi:hypothetical protein VTO42DRAFT_4706 [Malbranchea cinnamomea]
MTGVLLPAHHAHAHAHAHTHSYAYRRKSPRRPLGEIDRNGTMSSRGRGTGRPSKSQTQPQVKSKRGKAVPTTTTTRSTNAGIANVSGPRDSASPSPRGKRKAGEYEEDVEGFQFSRTTQSKRPRPESASRPVVEPQPPPQPVQPEKVRRGRPPKTAASAAATAAAAVVATPTNGAVTTGTGWRRSKRLSDEGTMTTTTTTAVEKPSSRTRRRRDSASPGQEPTPIYIAKKRPTKRKTPEPEPEPEPESEPGSPPPSRGGHAYGHGQDEEEDGDVTARIQQATISTKIALPAADTPVIRKNKQMRQEKAKKGQRRSSLSMRGRRASSLIDSGVSNALPHDAVQTADFYKHIESEGLPEPRRMRQLLTWCATRALGEKPMGSRSEDESARLAARVIQEELIKELGTRSELSDWFGRQETTPPPVVVRKPNPKNVQNAAKLKELEEHIQRLQEERKSLAALLKAPTVPQLTSPAAPRTDEHASASSPGVTPEQIDGALLDPAQQAVLATLTGASSSKQQTDHPSTAAGPASSTSMAAISSRLSRLSLSLAATLDSFSAGIHDIELFRSSSNDLARRILGICAQKLEERDLGIISSGPDNGAGDHDGREGGGKPPDSNSTSADAAASTTMREREDLSLVLGALSRLERRL